MEQLNYLIQLIQNTTGIVQNDEIRKQSESQIKNFSQQNPNDFILCCIHLLQAQETTIDTKKFVASQIRKNLSIYSEQTYKNLWDQLTPENQSLVKAKLFQCLEQEQNKTIRKLICDAIGEIGGTLMEEVTSKWPELIGIVWSLFSQDNEIYQESGFWILANLLCYSVDKYEKFQIELFTLFKNGIEGNSQKIKLAAIQTYAAYIQVLDPKECKKFESLLPSLYDGVYVLVSSDEEQGEEALTTISDIVEAEPKIFKKTFEKLFEMIFKVSQGVKKIGTELILVIVERINNIMKNRTNLIKQLLDMIFYHMIDIENNIDDQWKSPPEGFNEDIEEDSDFETTRFGMGAIDRLISAVGEKEMLPIISTTVQTLLQSDDWRYKFASLMALSQVGEYIDDIHEVEPIVKVIMTFYDSENAKIRYAVCHSIGQIADDMKPDFQERFMQEIMPLMLNRCEDPIPRVSSHALAAITNLVESVSKELIKPFLEQILQKSFFMLQNGISILKENAVSCIAAAAEASKEYFHPYFQESMQALFQVYNGHTAKEYKQLRGQTIECITLIAHGVDKTLFSPYLTQIVEILITLQESKFEQTDPQKSYVLSGWQRICLVFPNELIQYLPRIIPSLFNLVKNVFLIEETVDGGKTYDQEEGDIAINMLEVFIDKLKFNFMPYIDECTKIMIELCKHTKSNDDIRVSACRCLPALISCIQNNAELQIKMVKYFLGVLYDISKLEYETDMIIAIIQTMKECLEKVKTCFNEQELNDFSQKIFEILMGSDKRKAANEQYKGDEDLDDDEKELIQEDQQNEEELHVKIAELFGTIFKTHKEISQNLANTLYTTILPKVIQENLSDKMHKFGLFLIDDMVEYLGYQICQDKWNGLAEALVKFAKDKNLQVRQAAVYGLGKVAEQTPQQVYAQFSQVFLNTINEALNMENPSNQKEKNVGKFKDNCIAAMGRIMQFQDVNCNVNQLLDYWLQNLPLKFDKIEALQMHELLVNIAISSPQMLFSNQNNIQKVILVYGQIIETKHCNSMIREKILQSLKQLTQEEVVTSNWNQWISNLNEIQKNRLQNAIKEIQNA